MTNDLARRVWQHGQGAGLSHTRRYGISQLVFYEEHADVRLTIQRERTMKHWSRAWKVNPINSLNPTWRDLYEELNA